MNALNVAIATTHDSHMTHDWQVKKKKENKNKKEKKKKEKNGKSLRHPVFPGGHPLKY